ncbi:MAG: hypothetical protein M3Q65_02260 [Chloroflexota bacterium]|nr:hypothetical protein [Chloroflexota bacterium]
MGRWPQRDPKAMPFDPVQANRYSYAGCNPVNYTDPSGLDWEEDCFQGAVVGGITGWITGAIAGGITGAILGGPGGALGGAAVGAIAEGLGGAVAGCVGNVIIGQLED